MHLSHLLKIMMFYININENTLTLFSVVLAYLGLIEFLSEFFVELLHHTCCSFRLLMQKLCIKQLVSLCLCQVLFDFLINMGVMMLTLTVTTGWLLHLMILLT